MKDFAAIDFETANFERSSVCAVGVVIVRGGKVVDQYYSLIRPEPEYYTYRCTQVHGLTEADTRCAPNFPEVWASIEPKIHGLPLVHTIRLSTKVALKQCSESISWTTPTMSSTVPASPLAEYGQRDDTIWMSLQPNVVTT